MAIKELTPIKAELNKFTTFTPEAATSAAEGFSFKLPRASDEYVVVIASNTSSTPYNITIKAPTSGSYAASSTDEVFQIGANETAALRFESARWANNDGTVVLIPENVAVKIAVLY